MMRHAVPIAALALFLAGCSDFGSLAPPGAEPVTTPAAAAVAPPPASALPVATGQTAASLDTTTAAERAAATAAPAAAGRELGRITVALGSPAEQGFWLKTALVSAPGKGRVVTGSGASVAVDLLPGESGGLLSLAAYRALGLDLTALPEVTVFQD